MGIARDSESHFFCAIEPTRRELLKGVKSEAASSFLTLPSPRFNPILSSVMHCSSVKYQLTHSIHPNNDLRKKCRKNRDTCTFSGSWSRSVIGRREQALRAYCCLRAICRPRCGSERERSIVTAISIMSRHIDHVTPYRSSSQKLARQYRCRDGEVNDQSCHIDQSRYKGRRSAGRV